MTESPKYAEVIQLAINNEQKAADMYDGLAERSDSPAAKTHFEQLANMERGHKVKLETMDMDFFDSQELKPPQDLKIADYVVNVKPSPEMSYRDALVMAMNKEKAAFKLYTKLAERAPNDKLRELFLSLAQEESKHKLRFELEYDEFVLREN